MFDLSWVARPALDDVVYDERLLCPSDSPRPCELTAYADGLRFRTTTQGCDDWYDIEAVARLMNAVLEHRGGSSSSNRTIRRRGWPTAP